MGYRIVKMSTELFEQMFAEGYTLPTRAGERLVCTKGLPEGAKLVSVSRNLHLPFDDVALKFEHESWENVPGERIAEIAVEFRTETIDQADAVQVTADPPAYSAHGFTLACPPLTASEESQVREIAAAMASYEGAVYGAAVSLSARDRDYREPAAAAQVREIAAAMAEYERAMTPEVARAAAISLSARNRELAARSYTELRAMTDAEDTDETERQIAARIAAGDMTVNQLRALRNLAPLASGDAQVSAAPAPADTEEWVSADERAVLWNEEQWEHLRQRMASVAASARDRDFREPADAPAGWGDVTTFAVEVFSVPADVAALGEPADAPAREPATACAECGGARYLVRAMPGRAYAESVPCPACGPML